MQQHRIDMVTLAPTALPPTAMANKIGTYGWSLRQSPRHTILYCSSLQHLRSQTLLRRGDPIEQRDPAEVTALNGRPPRQV